MATTSRKRTPKAAAPAAGKLIYTFAEGNAQMRSLLGGKGAGLFLARTIVEKAAEASRLGPIKVPRTWYVPSDGILEFIHHNNLEDVLNRKYAGIDQIRRDYPHLVQLFKSSSFPPALGCGILER